MADVGEGVGDTVVALGRILSGEAQDQVDHFLGRSGPAHTSAFAAAIPYGKNTQPSHKGIQRKALLKPA